MSDNQHATGADPVRVWLRAQARAWRTEHAPDMAAVSVWRERVLAAVGPVPVLGSARWIELPDTDPRKLAAAIPPAVAHLTENTPAAITLRLRHELAALDHAVVSRIRAASWDLAGTQDWRHAAHCPSHAALVRRRWTAKCFHCATEHAWTADSCPGCGSPPGTPAELRAAVARSWQTAPSISDRSVA